MKTRQSFPAFLIAVAILLALAIAPQSLRAQEGKETDPASALASILSAACRSNQTQFAAYLTTDSAAAFKALTDDQRAQLVKRFALSDSTGRPLISSDPQGHSVVRCETPDATIEFRFGAPRVRENLAFVPVKVKDGQENEFGLVRETGGWRLLSLGLVLIDIPQLTKQWASQNLEIQETAAVDALRGIADAVETYRRAYGKLPDSLAQLGPAAKDDVSPDKASLVNEHIAAGAQGGYHFRYRIASGTDPANPGFELSAAPDEYGKTGRRSLFWDASGKIHVADRQSGMASAADPLLEEEKQQ
jgi:type II secretory pathway pseudopilin PulG